MSERRRHSTSGGSNIGTHNKRRKSRRKERRSSSIATNASHTPLLLHTQLLPQYSLLDRVFNYISPFEPLRQPPILPPRSRSVAVANPSLYYTALGAHEEEVFAHDDEEGSTEDDSDYYSDGGLTPTSSTRMSLFTKKSSTGPTRETQLDKTRSHTSKIVGDDNASDNLHEAQAGVKRLEAVSLTWTRTALYIAYASVLLMAFATSLEGQTTSFLTAYATSSFGVHSLLSTVSIVSSVLYAVVKPPMAKIADTFGRFEAFTICIVLFVIGYAMLAASGNVETFAAAQIFYASGATGLGLLQQIFIADTTDLLNRALLSSLPDTPFLATVWIGPLIADDIAKHSSWRWGYAIWCFILPVASAPLLWALFSSQNKAKKRGLLVPYPWKGQGVWSFLKSTFWELDIIGILLLTAGLTLLLIPLTLAANARDKWGNPSLIAMLVVGAVCLVVFPFFEMSRKWAPTPLVSLRLLTDRTVIGGCCIAFFYFMAFYLSVYPFFYSYLLVVNNMSITAAGHIVSTFNFTATVSSVIVSVLIKYTKHYKYFVLVGICIYMLGLGLMLRYRVEGSSTTAIVLCQIVIGIGGGCLNVPTQLGVQASATHQEVGAATALFLTILSVGGAVGSAISGAIWSSNILSKLEQYLPADLQSQAHKIFGDISIAQSYTPGTPARIAINRAYQETMNKLLICAVCCATPMIFFVFMMKNYKLDEVNQHVKGTVFGSSGEDHAADEQEIREHVREQETGETSQRMTTV